MKSEKKRIKFFNLTHLFYIVLVCLCVSSLSYSYGYSGDSSSQISESGFNSLKYSPNLNGISEFAFSDNGTTLWVSSGGLQKRDIATGKIIKSYTVLDGLPGNGISCLLDDGPNGLWVGTNGLVNIKPDGTMKIFSKDNSALSSNNIRQLIKDKSKGVLVLESNGGLTCFKDENNWEFLDKSIRDRLPGNNIDRISQDGDGGLWFAISNEPNPDEYPDSLVHIKANGNIETFNKENSDLPSIFDTKVMLSDNNGGLWVGTDIGLIHLKHDGNVQLFTKENSILPSSYINNIATDDFGGIWIGSGKVIVPMLPEEGGLLHLKSDGSWELFDNETDEVDIPLNYISTILNDGEGGVLVGTAGKGYAHFTSEKKWIVFFSQEFGISGHVTSLLYSKSGDLLATTWNEGLIIIYPDDSFKTFFTDFTFTSIIDDGDGGFWLGALGDMTIGENFKQGGVLHLTNKGYKLFTGHNSCLANNMVSSLLDDGKGGFWVGAYSIYPDKALTHVLDVSKNGSCRIALPGWLVSTLLADDLGGVWVGTSDGLLNYNANEEVKLYHVENSELPDNSIESLLRDNKGGVWIGSEKGGLSNLDSSGQWKHLNTQNSGLPTNYVTCLLHDGLGGIWIGANDSDNLEGGLVHLTKDGSWKIFNKKNTGIPNHHIDSLLGDKAGGLWIGTYGGLAHLLLIGSPEQLIKPNSPEITINWFLNSSSLDYQNVKYIELQRSLSQDGVYETVLDASDKPVRFYADYSQCPKPRVDNCWVTVEEHTPETRTNSDGSTTKGYRLNTPINDPEWLEGLPRYYRLSAVIEENGKLVRVANNSEAALITPQVEEKPRVELTLDRNAIAMLPNQKAEITVFVSSLDLFRGDVALEIESGEGVSISDSTNTANGRIVETHGRASLRGFNASENGLSSTISLKSGETKPVLLTIDAFAENTQTIKIIPKIQSGYSGKSTSLDVQVGDGTESMIALSIAHKTKRTRVLDGLTISGNVIPAQAVQKVVISGNNITNSPEYADSNDSLTLTTDENGYFQGTVTPIHAGLLTLTAKSNGITSNNAEIFILPARTNIALSSNVNQSTKKGDILRVQGIITPVRLDGTKVNLDIRYLDPANQDAGLQPQFVGGVEIDANGVFYRDVVVPGNGFINVKASLPETSDYLSINTKLVIPIGQPVGEGIIVVSESGDADFQTISKSLGNYVYNALKSRNIPAERIKYLGIADDPKFTNGTANKANLHDSLTNWATTLFSTDDPYKTPLNLYLIGKVEDDNGFRLNDSEVLTADDLAQYLNETEEIIKTNSKGKYSEYKGFPVTIVLEGTQSGKWIEKIAGNGRIILTSSSDKPVDEGGFAGYDNLGESSFSRYFYQFINYGSDIEGSFAEANYEILKFYRHTQRPVMDADGDGVGTTNFDRYEASGKFIEYRPSGNLRPQIRTTNPDLTINRRIRVSGSQSDVDNPILWAIATDPENEMQGVFCSISSITDPSNRTVNIEMKQKSDKVNVYEADLSHSYPNLSTGCYQAVYYAKDKAGNVSLPEQKFINVIASSGVLLEAPQIKITTKENMVTVSWSEVQGADGYKLFYCPYPDCSPADIGEIDMGKQREITFDGRGFAFYGAVKAYNSNGLSGWSNVEFFNLR
ncbi:MAG: hypothetical protein HQK63_13485 [Desulfamplus sp.]|nr:hypothetical protein [Desulfamplus sp.]